MITNNGYRWTDHAETHAAYEAIVAHYDGAACFRPMCGAEKRDGEGKPVACGKTTCYVVVTPAEMNTRLSWLCFAPADTITKHDGNFYYPVQRCVECEAGPSGYHDGRYAQHAYQRTLAGILKGPLTHEEIVRWKEIYIAAYERGRAQAAKDALERSARKDKARYLPMAKASARA